MFITAVIVIIAIFFFISINILRTRLIKHKHIVLRSLLNKINGMQLVEDHVNEFSYYFKIKQTNLYGIIAKRKTGRSRQQHVFETINSQYLGLKTNKLL